MEIIQGYPPIYSKIVEAIGEQEDSVIYTYGAVIYAPTGGPIDKYLMAHESIHMEQQGDNPCKWWDTYLNDIQFRIDQETEAYHAQYKAYAKDYKDRNARAQYLMFLAGQLSGPMYGYILLLNEARERIRHRRTV